MTRPWEGARVSLGGPASTTTLYAHTNAVMRSARNSLSRLPRKIAQARRFFVLRAVGSTLCFLVALLPVIATAQPAASAAPLGGARPPYGALVQLPGAAGCISASADEGCAPGRGFSGSPVDIAVAPDGGQLYVAAERAIVVLHRDRQTGALMQLPGPAGCINRDGKNGCARGRLAGAGEIVLAPSGRHVYASYGSMIVAFARDARTGSLLQLHGRAGCLVASRRAGCDVARGLSNISAMAISPDGRNVYASDVAAGAVWIFHRSATNRPAPSADGSTAMHRIQGAPRVRAGARSPESGRHCGQRRRAKRVRFQQWRWNRRSRRLQPRLR